MADIVTIAGTLIGGGLAGSILTQLVHLYRRPRLHLIFDQNQSGCEVETSTTASALPTQRYLRIKILNTGRSTAENVSVSVTRISFAAPGQAKPSDFGEEVLDLKLALTGECPFRVAPGGHRFVDLCLTVNNPGRIGYAFDFLRNPVRLGTFGWGPGRYTAELFASADAARPRRAVIEWAWDGTFSGLHAIKLGYMH